MAIKYKPGGKSRGFKNIGEGLRAGERRLTEQQKRSTDAIRLAQLQQKENDKNFISGLESKHRFEEGVLSEKQKLEGLARQHRFDAFKKYAETEVAYLDGVAKQKKDYAEWVAQYGPFAPKSVAAYSNIAKGGVEIAQKLKGRALWNEANQTGLIAGRTKATDVADLDVKQEFMLDGQKVGGKEWNALYSNVGKSSNVSYGYQILDHKKKNKTAEHSKAKTFFQELGIDYNKNSAVEYMKFFAHEELDRLGIKRNSEAARAIMNFYVGLAADDTYAFEGQEDFEQTEGLLADAVAKFNAQRAIEVERMVDPNDHTKGTRPETAEERKERLSIYFNMIVLTTKEGTFKDKQGGILRPGIGDGRHGYNNATAYEAVLNHLGTNYNDVFASTDVFKEDLGNLSTLPVPDGKGGFKPSTETWGIKHPLRLERGGDAHSDYKVKKANAKKASIIVSENEVLTTSFDERYAAAKKDPNININEFLAGEVTQAHGYTKGNEVAKNHVYKIAGLSANQYSSAHIFGSISALYHGGNVDDAQTLFASQSPQVQRLLAPEFDTFLNVEKSGFSFKGKATVSESLDAYVDNKVSAAETYVGTGSTSKVMNNSAYHIMIEMKNDIVNEYTRLLASKEYKDDHKGAMNAAIALVDKKFEEGAPDKKGEKGWETNKYRRTKGGYGINNVPGLNYEAYAASSDAPLVEKIKAIRTSREDISKTDVGDVKVDKFTTDTITNIHKYEELQGDQKDSEDYLLTHPRALADTHDTKDWDDRLTGPNPGYRGVDFEVHPNIIAFHEATQIPVYEILNRLMIRDGREGRFIAGGEDGVSWKNDGKFVRKRNVQGVNQWCSAKAQGGDECYPMSEQARAYFNNKYGGSDFFFEHNNISHYFDDTGALKVSNLNGYIENGGLHNLPPGMTPTNAINSFGLMGIPFSTGVE